MEWCILISHSLTFLLAYLQRVRAEIALMTALYVIATLVINAPLLGPLLTSMDLNKVSSEQLHLRRRVLGMLQV